MTDISYPGFKEAEGKTTDEIRKSVRKMASEAKQGCLHPTLQAVWGRTTEGDFSIVGSRIHARANLGPVVQDADLLTVRCASCAEVLLTWIKGKGVLEASTPEKKLARTPPLNDLGSGRIRVPSKSGGR